LATSGTKLPKLLGLKLNMAGFVPEDLVTKRAENPRASGFSQRGVVRLGDDFGGYQHGNRNLERARQMAKVSEDSIRKAALGEAQLVDAKEAGEIPPVTLFLPDEESDCQEVVAVTSPVRVGLSVSIEVMALRTLSSLELTD